MPSPPCSILGSSSAIAQWDKIQFCLFWIWVPTTYGRIICLWIWHARVVAWLAALLWYLCSLCCWHVCNHAKPLEMQPHVFNLTLFDWFLIFVSHFNFYQVMLSIRHCAAFWQIFCFFLLHWKPFQSCYR